MYDDEFNEDKMTYTREFAGQTAVRRVQQVGGQVPVRVERVGQGGRVPPALQGLRQVQVGIRGEIRARGGRDRGAAAEAQGRPRIVHVHVHAAQVQDG